MDVVETREISRDQRASNPETFIPVTYRCSYTGVTYFMVQSPS